MGNTINILTLISFFFRLGVKSVQSSQQLNSGWHNVHITRNDQSVEMKITDAGEDSYLFIFFFTRK